MVSPAVAALVGVVFPTAGPGDSAAAGDAAPPFPPPPPTDPAANAGPAGGLALRTLLAGS
jgi:hypothetical protein